MNKIIITIAFALISLFANAQKIKFDSSYDMFEKKTTFAKQAAWSDIISTEHGLVLFNFSKEKSPSDTTIIFYLLLDDVCVNEDTKIHFMLINDSVVTFKNQTGLNCKGIIGVKFSILLDTYDKGVSCFETGIKAMKVEDNDFDRIIKISDKAWGRISNTFLAVLNK